MIRVAIITLGCKVNQYESAGMMESLEKSGCLSVPFNAKADCCIINTCTVTARTDYQSRNLIRRAQKTNPDARIIVTGCYAQIAPRLLAGIPGVTKVLGNAEKEMIGRFIEDLPGKGAEIHVSDIAKDSKFSELIPSKFAGHTRAFLKIQDGCNSFCSYCIVPYARGPSRSLGEEDVLTRIKMLAGCGYREIVLTGIHLGAYGQDLSPPSNISEILKAVETHATLERLRLSSIEITEIQDDIIGIMARETILCRHLHIPLQSGDDGILSAMGRNYDSTFFRDRVIEIKEAVPYIAIGIDVMAGFPGEGEKEFENTTRLIAELPVAYLHVFPYSERPGTLAARLPGKVDEVEKKRRCDILRKMGREKRTAFAEGMIGKELKVLVEDKKDRRTGLITGFSDNYVPVLIEESKSPFLVNHVLKVRPDYALDGRLHGRITSHA